MTFYLAFLCGFLFGIGFDIWFGNPFGAFSYLTWDSSWQSLAFYSGILAGLFVGIPGILYGTFRHTFARRQASFLDFPGVLAGLPSGISSGKFSVVLLGLSHGMLSVVYLVCFASRIRSGAPSSVLLGLTLDVPSGVLSGIAFGIFSGSFGLSIWHNHVLTSS